MSTVTTATSESKVDRLRKILASEDSCLPNREIAELAGCSESTVRKIQGEMEFARLRAENEALRLQLAEAAKGGSSRRPKQLKVKAEAERSLFQFFRDSDD